MGNIALGLGLIISLMLLIAVGSHRPGARITNTKPPSKPPKGDGYSDNSSLGELMRVTPPPKPKRQLMLDDSDRERIHVLVQALRLVLRHLENSSGLSNDEVKDYIKTILKIY